MRGVRLCNMAFFLSHPCHLKFLNVVLYRLMKITTYVITFEALLFIWRNRIKKHLQEPSLYFVLSQFHLLKAARRQIFWPPCEDVMYNLSNSSGVVVFYLLQWGKRSEDGFWSRIRLCFMRGWTEMSMTALERVQLCVCQFLGYIVSFFFWFMCSALFVSLPPPPNFRTGLSSLKWLPT